MRYLQLCRFPTVFTALADIVLGYLLSRAAIDDWTLLGLLLGASAGLYLSGMVFNDLFDVDQDLRERPHRPIPSQAISLQAATAFGIALMLAGLACAALAGRNSLVVAAAISVSVLAYDRFLKRTPLGPLGMGTCRLLNVLLGASGSGERLAAIWQLPQLWVAISVGVYITGVTWFARREASSSRSYTLLAALVVIDAGLLMHAAWMTGWANAWGVALGPGGLRDPSSAWLLLGVTAFVINRRCLRAIYNPRPERIQSAIAVMLLSIIVINATLIYFKLGQSGIPCAIATVTLLLPAMLLKRWIPLT